VTSNSSSLNALVVQVCQNCNKTYYPYKARCRCGSTNFRFAEVNPEGRVLTYTVIYVPPKGFKPPLKVALVELSGGFKLLGRYDDSDEPRIGERVIVELRDGVAFFKRLPREDG